MRSQFRSLTRKALLVGSFVASLAIVLSAQAPGAVTNVRVFAKYTPASGNCNQTFSTGNNAAITSAASSAPNDTTICLNAGNYGAIAFSNITARTGYVTVRAVTGASVTMAPSVHNSTFLFFQDLTATNAVVVDGCSKHIKIDNVVFEKVGLSIDAFFDTCSNFPLDITISNTKHYGDSGGGEASINEGRIGVRDRDPSQGNMGVVIENCEITNRVADSTFSYTDGLQLTGGASGVTFRHCYIHRLKQDSNPAAAHSDAVQYFGGTGQNGINNIVEGNIFEDCDSILVHHGAQTDNTIWRYNVHRRSSNFQVDNSINFVGEHNIFWTDSGTQENVNMNTQGRSGAASVIWRDNIWIGNVDVSHIGSGTYTSQFNLCDDSPQCNGTNQIIGNPTFTGGAIASLPINSMAGYALTNGSVGKGAAHDGSDVGTLYTGPVGPQ